MPTYKREIKIPSVSAEQLYQKISVDINFFLKDLRQYLTQAELIENPKDKSFIFRSSQFNATLSCHDEEVKLQGELGFLAWAFKSKIDQGIDLWLKKNFLKT